MLGKSVEDLDGDKYSGTKKQSTLKLLLEFYSVGVVEDTGIFVEIPELLVYVRRGDGDKVDSRTSLFQEGEYDAVIEDKSWRLRKEKTRGRSWCGFQVNWLSR
ncbi:regulator of nonsense transcripts UPF2-like [Salvia hispanica]|uniref:regulator of nonsense transcripts UPF2-like n=1 Tax=Salvia hispanica TaxID=49212 RepID=UPI00200906AF|nr:regulator of nonsense transcripts UPF2-like [Salvia hispanica]